MTRNLLRWIPLAGLAALAVLALPAAAEWYEGKPDCPPDRMCTMSGGADGNATGEPVAYGPEDCIECSKGPDDGRGPADCENCRDVNATDDGPTSGDCGGEVCAYDRPDQPVSDSTGGQGTCMDGTASGCRDDVQYLDGREPAQGGAEVASQGASKAVPGAGFLALLAAAVAVAGIAAYRRR